MASKDYNTLKHIYLVDDDEDDRSLFAEVLHEEDRKVSIREAKNGYYLMDMLSSQVESLPDVIILDLNMPMKNGFECLSEIRTCQKMRELSIIILSTSDNPEIIEKAFKLGADFYAVKPTTVTGIKTLIKNILQIDWQQRDRDLVQFRLC